MSVSMSENVSQGEFLVVTKCRGITPPLFGCEESLMSFSGES